MAKIKITPDSVSVVKKTLTLGAPKKMEATQDSTAYFRGLTEKRLENLKKYEQDFFKNFKNASLSDLMQEEGYKNILKGIESGALNRMRQANKGKEGFDKNGYPLPKVSAPAMKAIASKLTGK